MGTNFGCLLHLEHRHRLAERNGFRLERFSTVVAVRRFVAGSNSLDNLGGGPLPMTGDAFDDAGCPVQLDDTSAFRILMEPINVLRNHGHDVSLAFELGESEVTIVGFGLVDLLVEFQSHGPVSRPRFARSDEFVIQYRRVLCPYPTRTTKVAKTALRTDPGTGEGNATVGRLDEFGELFEF